MMSAVRLPPVPLRISMSILCMTPAFCSSFWSLLLRGGGGGIGFPYCESVFVNRGSASCAKGSAC
jgi:hypothetical protein